MKLPDPLPDRKTVHVWLVELDSSIATLEACSKSLACDEIERSARFNFEHLRSDFVLCRGILRALLGRYLAIEASRIEFAYGPKGKPRLNFPESPLRFNLAHSGRFAVYAFAVGCELGIDIEQIKGVPNQEGIVRQFFSQEECEDWFELDASEREAGFYRCWTRKEAYIKARGDGLSMPLDRFRVSLRPGVPAELIHVGGNSVEASTWRLCSLKLVEGYLGALALPDRERRVAILPRLNATGVFELLNGTDMFPPAANRLVSFCDPQAHS